MIIVRTVNCFLIGLAQMLRPFTFYYAISKLNICLGCVLIAEIQWCVNNHSTDQLLKLFAQDLTFFFFLEDPMFVLLQKDVTLG